jgi:hypothetical protein
MNNNWIKINDKYNPTTVNEITNNKYIDIHNKLYKNALSKYIDRFSIINNLDLSYIKDNYKFIEIKDNNKYYYEPSYIYQISRFKPYKKEKIYLGEYWDNNYILSKKTKKEDFIFKYDNEYINSCEIEYYDYINGTVTLSNKFDNKKKKINFSDISENMRISKNILK